MLSLSENCIFLSQVTVLGVCTDASRGKGQAGRRGPGGFLKPIVPEGAIPALVMVSLLINSLQVRNLLNKQTQTDKQLIHKGTVIFIH